MFKHWTPCFKLSNQTPSQRSTQNPKAILKYYCVCVRKVREKSTCGTCNPKPREALYPQNPKGNIVYVWKVLVARVTQNPQNPEKHYIPKKQKGNIVYVWEKNLWHAPISQKKQKGNIVYVWEKYLWHAPISQEALYHLKNREARHYKFQTILSFFSKINYSLLVQQNYSLLSIGAVQFQLFSPCLSFIIWLS